MKKKVIAFLCALALLVGLLPAGAAAAASEEATTQQYLVGYAKKDINPWVKVDPDTKEMVVNPETGRNVFVSPDKVKDEELGLYTGLFALTGNGDDEDRLFDGLFDDNGDGVQGKGDGVFTTATAITDHNGKTVIYITIDALQGYDEITKDARDAIVKNEKLNGKISEDQIMVSASHTHSGAQYSNMSEGADKHFTSNSDGRRQERKDYYQHVINQITDAAVAAYEDRSLATMYKGTVDAQKATKALRYNPDEDGVYQGYHMNAVRHYEVTTTGSDDKYIIGSTSNYLAGEKTYKPVEESDNDMHVLLFQFDDPETNAPVVFVNWRAHTTMNSGVKETTLSANFNGLKVNGKTQLSSDYVNGLRTTLEKDGYRAAFFQGAAGNIVTAARDEVWKNTDDSELAKYKDWLNQVDKEVTNSGDREARKTFIYGRMLAKIAEYCIQKNMKKLPAGAIRTQQITWHGDVQRDSVALHNLASTVTGLTNRSYPYRDKTSGETLNLKKHKDAIVERWDHLNDSEYTDLELNVILLGGNVAFVTAPNELADKYYTYDENENAVKTEEGLISATDNNDWKNLVDNATYGTPFVLGYTNGRKGYIGNWLDHITNSPQYTDITDFAAGAENIYGPGTYESNTSRFAKGEGEELINQYKTILNRLKPHRVAKCEACGETVEWTAIGNGNYDANNYVAAGHYYLAENIADTGKNGQWNIGDGTNIQTTCIDLMGHDKTSVFRNFYVNNNATLNLMDSVGDGVVHSHTNSGTGEYYGGNVYVAEGGTFVLYGGTLKFQRMEYDNYKGVTRGGVVYIDGTMEMRGGTIIGGDMEKVTDDTNDGCGGAIYVRKGQGLRVYGGTIKSGTVSDPKCGPCVYVHGANANVTLGGDANVDNIYFYNTAGKNLIIKGEYTGKAGLTYEKVNDSTTISNGADIGECITDEDTGTSPSLAGDNITCTDVAGNFRSVVYIDGTNLKLSAIDNNTGALLCGSNGARAYGELNDAISAYSDGYIKLMEEVENTVEIRENITIDLNGYNMFEVKVADGCTLYGMDCQTDDYTVQDEAGYGKIKKYTKIDNYTGKVAGVIAGSEGIQDNYLMVTEENVGVSFHAVNLRLTAMNLRASSVGVYYKSKFGGDELVAPRVLEYGVALSVVKAPTEKNLDAYCKRSILKGFEPGGGMDTDNTSTLLKGVMKTTYSESTNREYSTLPVYGRAYIRTEDGYLFGAHVQRSFKEQVEMVDDYWHTLTPDQKTSVVEMYKTYKTVMDDWDIPNIIAKSKDDDVLRVLMIGHSLGNDAMWMQPAVFANEAPDTKVVLGFLYYDGCKLSAHVKYAQENSAVYGYAEFDSTKGHTYWQVANTDGTMRPLEHDGTLNGEITENGISQTSLFAIQRQDWDVVVTQGYPWEVAKVSNGNYSPNLIGNFNSLKQYVLDNDINKETIPEFGWNMVWTFPDDDDLIRDGDRDILTKYFEGNVVNYYNKSAQIVQNELVPVLKFDYVFPSSTAFINALSGYKTTKDMYRDYAHASDFGRAMIAYLWYCNLTDTDISDCDFEPIHYQYRKEEDDDYKNKNNIVLTPEEKQTIVEVVGNALAKPYEITPKA